MSPFLRACAVVVLLPLGCDSSDVAHGAGDAGTPDTAKTDIAAAERTANTEPLCTAIAPFYWEIGDGADVLGSGSVGDGTYDESTSMPIASASKWMFGAYVVERFADDLSAIDVPAMTMESGYTNFDNVKCEVALPATVQRCFDGGTRNQVNPDPATTGSFDYNGGHFQKYAVDLGLGSDSNAELAAEYRKYLGADLDLAFGTPLLAGGMRTTPATYRLFLQKLLSGSLALAAHLGEASVCTVSAGGCKATFSPAAPYAWRYSYAHWVEDDSAAGDDGSFSSPGLFGFYPWIDRTKAYYGIVARKSEAAKAYLQSVECGRLIRRAFFGG